MWPRGRRPWPEAAAANVHRRQYAMRRRFHREWRSSISPRHSP
uniref:Uncharacterized protein n=1 Tax=Rhizophora mucronata TaxID=61149 RepID=A0A2P2PM71_RHIMU